MNMLVPVCSQALERDICCAAMTPKVRTKMCRAWAARRVAITPVGESQQGCGDDLVALSRVST